MVAGDLLPHPGDVITWPDPGEQQPALRIWSGPGDSVLRLLWFLFVPGLGQARRRASRYARRVSTSPG